MQLQRNNIEDLQSAVAEEPGRELRVVLPAQPERGLPRVPARARGAIPLPAGRQVQYSTVQYRCTVQMYSTGVHYKYTVQCSTNVQYKFTVQYSSQCITVQYMTVQCSTGVQYNTEHMYSTV